MSTSAIGTGTLPTRAELVDRVIDLVLAGNDPGVAAGAVGDASLRPLARAAAALERALVPVPPSVRFEALLGTRLAHLRLVDRASRAIQRPNRLLVGAAVSSAAIGVGVTAFAVWRSARQHAAPA